MSFGVYHVFMSNKNDSIIPEIASNILPKYLTTCPSCSYRFIDPKSLNIALKKKHIMNSVLNRLQTYEDVAKSFNLTRQRVGQIIKEYKKYGY